MRLITDSLRDGEKGTMQAIRSVHRKTRSSDVMNVGTGMLTNRRMGPSRIPIAADVLKVRAETVLTSTADMQREKTDA